MSRSSDPAWIQAGSGAPPRLRWSFRTEAELVGLALAREAGVTFAADASGGVYTIDRTGQLLSVSRSFNDVTQIVCGDTDSNCPVRSIV